MTLDRLVVLAETRAWRAVVATPVALPAADGQQFEAAHRDCGTQRGAAPR
jgi:hypothetical protein